MSGPAIAIATRGVVCCKRGATVVTSLAPDAQLSVLEPEVVTGDKGAPAVKVEAGDLQPAKTDIRDSLAPQLTVDHVAPQVPDAKPKKSTDTPSTKIRPVVDLSPTIVDKKKD